MRPPPTRFPSPAPSAGGTQTEVPTGRVEGAVEERLDRLRREGRGQRLADELDRIALHCSGLPVLDAREADEIIGYDEYGVPGP